MTNEQHQKAFYLNQAIKALERAKQLIEHALGDSDVTQMYSKDIVEILEELDEDIESINASPLTEQS